jgi:hypothetical protein
MTTRISPGTRAGPAVKLLHVGGSILGQSSVSRQFSVVVVKRPTDMRRSATIWRRADRAFHRHASNRHPGRHPRKPGLAEGTGKKTARALVDLPCPPTSRGRGAHAHSVSSQLKAWIDQLAVVGKKVVIASRGGFYGSLPQPERHVGNLIPSQTLESTHPSLRKLSPTQGTE